MNVMVRLESARAVDPDSAGVEHDINSYKIMYKFVQELVLFGTTGKLLLVDRELRSQSPVRYPEFINLLVHGENVLRDGE